MKTHTQNSLFHSFILSILFILSFSATQLSAQEKSVSIQWDKIVSISRTTPTLQVVVNPMLKRNSPIHKGSFKALNELGADYVRFVPWFPYPKAAVVELKEPTKTETFWDFSNADPIVEDFMNATKGHSVVMNFSTIPVWMFKITKPVMVPDDPDQVFWDYNQGRELRDPSMKELSDYFVRLFSWYTKGGFTDELGQFHKSDHYYKFPYWEVLNEPDLEHKITPQLYTKMYDAIVGELKKISPETKFVGISVALETDPQWFEYFLNPVNHKPGIPPEGISYHFYGRPSSPDQAYDSFQYSFFDQANGFLDRVRYIENIRKRLAPNVFTQINEIGNILSDRNHTGVIPDSYWNLSGAMYAYIYVELAKIGIDVAGESQLVGYPTQFPDVSMMNWKNGNPNSRFWVLKLIKEHFGPGDKLVTTSVNSKDVSAQGFITSKGKKLLLINKNNKDLKLNLPGSVAGKKLYTVNTTTGEKPAAEMNLTDNNIIIKPFSVSVVEFKE